MSPLALSIRFLQSQPDGRLLALARDGHERAFEALVRRHRRSLLAYSRRVAPPDANPEDILQQSLLQAWSALAAGMEVRDARAWFHRIVHNVAVSDLRRPRCIPVELENGAGVSGADHVVEQRLAVREALASLASLPDLQREVMIRTAMDGMSHEELATTLGLSSGAVRGLIYRARAALRSAAAALIPSPVVAWAARQGSDRLARSNRLIEAMAGGGSAGLGGVVLKGGAVVVAAGALATAAGITTQRHPHRQRNVPAIAIQAAQTSSRGAAVNAPAVSANSRPAPGKGERPVLIRPDAASATTLAGIASGSPDVASGEGGQHPEAAGGDSSSGGSRQSSGGGSEHSSSGGSSGGSDGHSGGSGTLGDQTSGSGSDGGSGGSSDGGTMTSSSDGGTATSSSDGGSTTPSSDGGSSSSGGNTSTSPSIDGGSHDGGSQAQFQSGTTSPTAGS